MFWKTSGILLIFAICFGVASVYAGKMELTTYYPAPSGDYDQLSANKQTYTSDKVQPGTSGRLRLPPQLGNPDKTNLGDIWDASIAKLGEIAYSEAKKGLVIFDGTAWASVAGSSGKTCVVKYGIDRNCTNACNAETEDVTNLGYFGACFYGEVGSFTRGLSSDFPAGWYGRAALPDRGAYRADGPNCKLDCKNQNITPCALPTDTFTGGSSYLTVTGYACRCCEK